MNIIKQKIEITDHGGTTFLNGEHVNRLEFKRANEKAIKNGSNIFNNVITILN